MSKKRKYDSELIPVERRKKVIVVESGRGRKRSKLEMAGYIFDVVMVLLVISVAAAFFMIYSRLSKIREIADNAVPELREAEDGTYELSWPNVEEAGADTYYVEVSTYAVGSSYVVGGTEDQKLFFSGYVSGTSCRLPDLPTEEGQSFRLQIDLIRHYTLMGEEKTWKQATIERYFYVPNPAIKGLDWEFDAETGKASVNFDFQGSNSCIIYVMEPDGGRKLLKTADENKVELDFNNEEGLWMPAAGNPCTLTFVPGNRIYSPKKNMVFYGGESKTMTVTWEDFAARDIHLSLDLIENCVCRLEWDEVEGDFYTIQMKSSGSGEWETVKTIPKEGDRTYVSQRLRPGTEYSFRVTAVTGDYAAVSEVRKCEIGVTPMYSTVWPVKTLKAYSDSSKSEVVGEAKLLQAYCVIDVENGMFGVDIDGRTGYIDSSYCMINLSEYVGALCSYDITNSYSSIFMAHGFEIPGLTGRVMPGFEQTRLADGGYLVPLLYPTAKKLETAIETAGEKGYRLKIYEAFRPHKASVYMYQTATAVQDSPLPESTYWGEEPGVSLTVRETDENGVTAERRKTYWELMNGNNSFRMTDFVSAGVSKHNIGVAMDLTLEDLGSGQELMMQTDIHDLSQFSARAQNSNEAKELSKIMMSSGFGDLYSEWWHFQDNEIINKLNPPCMDEGVSPACWMYNGFGWRYRGEEGNYAVSCTLVIDGAEYRFDSDGYVMN